MKIAQIHNSQIALYKKPINYSKHKPIATVKEALIGMSALSMILIALKIRR